MAVKFGFGIIGTGGIFPQHAAALHVLRKRARLIGLADLDADRLRIATDKHFAPHAYEDHRQLLDRKDIDVISIATPPATHERLIIDCLQAGKAVICEKPLAPTPREIRQMIDARDRAGKLLMTAQHFRYQGSSMALKAEIDSGVLGDVYHARSWMLRRGGAPTGAGFILKQHSGGGPCIDIGVHILDLTLWFMGNPRPVAVSGVARSELAKQEGAFTSWGRNLLPDEYDVEDFAAAFVRFETGATLILEVSWLLHHDTQGEDMQMWLYGTKAGLHWPQCEILESNLETRQFYNRTLKLMYDGLEPHAQECVAFAAAIANGAPSPVPAEQSLQVMGILDGIYRSQQAGGEVRLDGACG